MKILKGKRRYKLKGIVIQIDRVHLKVGRNFVPIPYIPPHVHTDNNGRFEHIPFGYYFDERDNALCLTEPPRRGYRAEIWLTKREVIKL